MLMIDVVQTRPAGGTRFKITIKGLNNVTQGSNQPAVYNDSGYVYISNLGATGNWEFGQETQNEPQWSEIQTINGQGGIDKHVYHQRKLKKGLITVMNTAFVMIKVIANGRGKVAMMSLVKGQTLICKKACDQTGMSRLRHHLMDRLKATILNSPATLSVTLRI